MDNQEYADLKPITDLLFRSADAWARHHAPQVRTRVLARISARNGVPSFVRWSLVGLVTSVAVILIFVYALPPSPPGSTVAPSIHRVAKAPEYPMIRLEKKQGKVIVRAEGVNGPLFLHKATDPKIIQKTPPIRLDKPVFEDASADRNTIVFYLVEPAPSSSHDS